MNESTTMIDPISQDIARISELMEPLGVASFRVPNLNAAAREIARLQVECDAPSVLISGDMMREFPEFMNALDATGVSWAVPQSLEASLDAPLGVSLVSAALVETGSVVLAEPSPSVRGVSLISLNLIMLIPVGRIVQGLDEGMAIISDVAQQGGYASFITGPSRTADIEMSLTVGVQGPKRVYYLFVDSVR